MPADFPAETMELTHLLVVADLDRARAFYQEVLGAEVYREYGGTSAVLRFLAAAGHWRRPYRRQAGSGLRCPA
jgi:catechol 2,3-dioxygenase-like lactoylglutathione lyase family enzyme